MFKLIFVKVWGGEILRLCWVLQVEKYWGWSRFTLEDLSLRQVNHQIYIALIIINSSPPIEYVQYTDEPRHGVPACLRLTSDDASTKGRPGDGGTHDGRYSDWGWNGRYSLPCLWTRRTEYPSLHYGMCCLVVVLLPILDHPLPLVNPCLLKWL